jgi:hypothetical protein
MSLHRLYLRCPDLQKYLFRDAGDDFAIGWVPVFVEVPEQELFHQKGRARGVPQVGEPDLIGQTAESGDGSEIEFALAHLGIERPSDLEGYFGGSLDPMA